MLKLIKSVILISLLINPAFAELSKYKVLKKSHLPQVYSDLDKAINKLEKSKDKKLLGEIINVYVQHHKFDRTYYPYEMLAPFYSKNKKMVKDALKKHKKKDSDLAIWNLETAWKEIVHGNG